MHRNLDAVLFSSTFQTSFALKDVHSDLTISQKLHLHQRRATYLGQGDVSEPRKFGCDRHA